jgi:hypothetical protein
LISGRPDIEIIDYNGGSASTQMRYRGDDIYESEPYEILYSSEVLFVIIKARSEPFLSDSEDPDSITQHEVFRFFMVHLGGSEDIQHLNHTEPPSFPGERKNDGSIVLNADFEEYEGLERLDYYYWFEQYKEGCVIGNSPGDEIFISLDHSFTPEGKVLHIFFVGIDKCGDYYISDMFELDL